MFKNYLWLVIIFIVMPIALSAQMHEENILLDMSHVFTTNDHSTDNDREVFFEKKSDLNFHDNRSRDVDTLWTKTFGGTDIEFGYAVQQTTDGGYIIAGIKYPPYGAGDLDIIIIKTDAIGDTLWTNIYGGDGDEDANDIRQTADGGYIITGFVYNDDSDLLLLKTDPSGNILWSKNHGGAGSERGFSVEPTTDDGYIIAGLTNSYGAGGYDIWLVKTNASGDTLWTKTFGGVVGDYGYCVQQTNDNGYIITGYTKSFGAGNRDVWLIKTDSDGNEQWNQTFGDTGSDVGMYGQQTTDGGYIITGRSNSYCAYGGNNIYLIKTDENGNSLWAKTFGGTGWNMAAGYCVQQVTDGGYIVAGWLDTDDGINNNGDVWLIKTNPSGESLWTKTINGNGNESYDIARSIQQTTDGGYIVTGATGIQDVNTDIWLIKTGEDPAPGSINGTVSLNGGTGNVDDVLIIAQPGNFQINPISGYYTLVVQEGDFDVTVSLEGYITQIFENVQVVQGQVTNLDITLDAVDLAISPDNFYFETTGTVNDVMNLQNQCTVNLDYQISVAFEGDDEIHYDGENYTAFGLTDGGTIVVAVRFTAEELANYYGSYNLTGINIFIDDNSFSNVTLKGWEGGSYGDPGAEIYSEDITSAIYVGDWKNHLLTTSFPLISGNEYWIGYSITHSGGGHPVGLDAGPMVAGKGGWIYFMDQWNEMANVGVDYNLNIRALVSNPWLACDPISGVIPSNGNVDVDLMVDATELDFGDYYADIIVKILPDYATYIIPVHLLKAIILDPPQNLDVACIENYAHFTWEAPLADMRYSEKNTKTNKENTRDLTGYNVYLGQVEVATNIPDLEYDFYDLINGNFYDAGVKAIYDEGTSELVEINFQYTGTGVENILPLITELTGNYPNPFNPITIINYSLAEESNIELIVFNIKGQHVKTLINEKLPAGNHQVVWDGKDDNSKAVSSGIYFYKMNTNNYTLTKKMILMK